MAYGLSALDLKLDALSLAGEPSDGTSEYEAEVYDWLTVVLRAIVSGGQFGPSLLEPIDWGWARAYPRGALQLRQPFNRAFTTSAAFVNNNLFVTVNGLPTQSLLNHRIMRTDVNARHLIISQVVFGATTILTLQNAWTGPTDTVDDWIAYPDTYELPKDFVRGCSPLYIAGANLLSSAGSIDLLDPADFEQRYPQGAMQGGVPVVGARVTDTRVRFSHYLDTPTEPANVQVEFDYIRQPSVLAEGNLPPVPLQHRRILAYGCAYLILADKDDSGAEGLWGMFQASYKAMRDEEVRDRRRMSSRWGVMQPPRASGESIRWTESGLPLWSW